jgi:SAM-dependent methyltransferase
MPEWPTAFGHFGSQERHVGEEPGTEKPVVGDRSLRESIGACQIGAGLSTYTRTRMNPTDNSGPSRYSFDRGWPRELERLETQARLLDPGTVRLLETLGVDRGWRCAEIGAGAGSIAAWLARRVNPGIVVATDVDTRFLERLQQDGLEIRRHDIVAGPLEEGAYDLVHTRLLLMHLPERERALRHMVASLRPGGWLLAEEYDLGTAGFFHPPSALQEKVVAALQSAGLEAVEAEGRLRVVPLGTADAEALALKLEQFRSRLLETGQLTEDELHRAIEEVRTPGDGAVHYPALIVAGWGRRQN